MPRNISGLVNLEGDEIIIEDELSVVSISDRGAGNIDFNSSLFPGVNLGYSLGSSEFRWNNLWIDDIHVTTNLDVNGIGTFISSLRTPILSPLGGQSQINIGGSLLPQTDSLYNLGSSSYRWSYSYTDNVDTTRIYVNNSSGNAICQIATTGSDPNDKARLYLIDGADLGSCNGASIHMDVSDQQIYFTYIVSGTPNVIFSYTSATFWVRKNIIPYSVNLNIGSNSDPFNNIYANTYNTVSDRRLKHSINELDMEDSMSIIEQLEPVSYKLHNRGDVTHYGLIADEVKEVLDVYLDDNNAIFREDEYQSLNYTQLIPHLINCIKHLSQRLDVVEKLLSRNM